MHPAQICLRPAIREDVPFLLQLRCQTMHPHLLASGLIPSLEEDMRRVLLRFDCAQVILLARCLRYLGRCFLTRSGLSGNVNLRSGAHWQVDKFAELPQQEVDIANQ